MEKKKPRRKGHRWSPPLTEEDKKEILRLAKEVKLSQQAIADQLGRGRKQIRNFLEEALPKELSPDPVARRSLSLLEPYVAAIEAKVASGLTTTRILREIRETGYQGGRTILAKLVGVLKAKLVTPPRRKQPKIRFETDPGKEMQFDFGTYRVPIGGVETIVHAFLGELAWSRYASVDVFRDQKQSSVFEGLDGAVRDFGGSAEDCVVDNVTAIVLGRTHVEGKSKPLFHPAAEDFAKHYGFTFKPCAPYDPDRKGKDENFVGYFERGVIVGSSFASWDDLRQRARAWCRDIANKRTHGTTGLVPEEVWRSRERDLLTRSPAMSFALHRDEPRAVAPDSTLSIGGTLYSVPAELANRVVTVRLYAHHFEVVDSAGRVAFTRSYVDPHDKGKFQLDPKHYDSLRGRPKDRGRRQRLDDVLRGRFPSLATLLDGITRRMKTLAHVELARLFRLVDRFGPEAFLAAATRAQDGGRHDARAVLRLLEQEYPLAGEDLPIAVLGGAGAVLLSDVEEESFERFFGLDGEDDDEEESRRGA